MALSRQIQALPFRDESAGFVNIERGCNVLQMKAGGGQNKGMPVPL